MKIKFSVILLLIASSLNCFSQSKEELKVKDFFWGENDTHKEATEIPEKWKNESAVILYKNQNYDFHKFARNVTYTTSTRKRIKLLDKSAVKEFSEFTFSDLFKPSKKILLYGIPIKVDAKRDKNNHVGIKVVKPNGKEIEIDLEKETVLEDGIAKIAVSNLEVGDIIDYYVYKVDELKSHIAFGFKPEEVTLAEEYPIVDFKLFFETENDFFINFKSFNGAPELKHIPHKKNSFRRYSLEASDIDKFTTNRWFYPLTEIPAYKFQVYFARSGKFENRALAFLPEKEKIIKKSVSEDEVLDLYDNRFEASGNLGDVNDFLKDKTFKNDREKVIQTYYYMRHYYLTRFIEFYYADKNGIGSYDLGNYSYKTIFIEDDIKFIKRFTAFLKKQKIDFEIVVGKKRYDGTIDDLLIEKNVNVILKINTEEPLYAEYFGWHSTINSFSPLMEGTDVYLLSASKNKIDKIKRGTLPTSSYVDNEEKRIINFEVSDDFSESIINFKNLYRGHAKTSQQNNKLIFTDFVKEDYEKFGTKSYVERIRKKKTKASVEKQMDALAEEQRKIIKEELEESIKTEFNLINIEDYSYDIKETGRYDFDSYMSLDESFKAKGAFIKKVGPNYIFEIGKLIGAQISLAQEEKNRFENIHMAYPRSFNYEIRFPIPKGYSVSGIDKLKINVDNKTGAFISNAKIEDNILIVTTSKQYKNNYEPNSNWPQMVEFLDAAFQFTNEKVLLKKK